MTDGGIALRIDKNTIDSLTEIAKDWAQAHGICMRLKDCKSSSDVMEIAPFSLVPSKVPRNLFDQAYSVQKDMSLLYHKVSFDYELIRSSLASVIKNDFFTKKLMEIYDVVHLAGALSQPLVLTIQRSDYMFHQTNNVPANQNNPSTAKALSLKQVEVNNIASSFAGLDTKVTDLHREVLRNLHCSLDINADRLPANQALTTVARGLTEALHAYNVPNAALLVVIEESNQNVIDQRLIEYEMLKNRKPPQDATCAFCILRLTLRQCFDRLYLSVEKRLLVKDTNAEVGVVYFRAGYVPQHYPSDFEWKARLTIEMSRAIKCPWIGAHLAGTKKIQQVLANPATLARYVADVDARQRVAQTFMGLFGLEADEPSTRSIVERARLAPDSYVLKPQLEGGGNNFYGKQVREKLDAMTPQEREAYILMERIQPVEHENVPVRPNQKIGVAKMVSEFGTFGFLLGSCDKVLSNQSGGHLLRTKSVAMDEGGVMAGASVLDSPYLV